jgi:hypothetical protein
VLTAQLSRLAYLTMSALLSAMLGAVP